jgi:hypothetical protein
MGDFDAFFHNSRGMCQGFPLSPCLYILIAKVLGRALATMLKEILLITYIVKGV